MKMVVLFYYFFYILGLKIFELYLIYILRVFTERNYLLTFLPYIIGPK